MFYGYVMAAGIIGIVLWWVRRFNERAYQFCDTAMLVLFIILAVWGTWTAVTTI